MGYRARAKEDGKLDDIQRKTTPKTTTLTGLRRTVHLPDRVNGTGRDILAAPFTDRWKSQSLVCESLGGPGSREFGERVLRDESRYINVTKVSPHTMSGEGGCAVLANDVGIRHDT
jgi:hypothetical protein